MEAGDCNSVRNRSEKRQLRALRFSGDVKLTPSVVRRSTHHRKLDRTIAISGGQAYVIGRAGGR
jgi:hypothetical protein